VAWLAGRIGQFIKVFGPRVRALALNEPPDMAGPSSGNPTPSA